MSSYSCKNNFMKGVETMSVREFFEMVRWNEYHNVRLKDKESDNALVEFSDDVPDMYGSKIISGIASDWEAHIYILWI